MIFCVLNPEKVWHQQLVQLPLHLTLHCSHFTLENPKKSFLNSIIHTYFRLFTLSQKKTNCYFLTHHTWKMSPQYLVKCTTFSSDWRYVALLQTLMALKKPVVGWQWWFRKRTFCDVWQMECQASNVTENVQSDHLLHRYMLPVFLATDQLHRPPRSVEIQPMSQRFRNSSVSRMGTHYSVCVKNLKNMKNLCILLVSAVTFFTKSGGQKTCICSVFRRLRDLMANIFWTKRDTDNRKRALESTRGFIHRLKIS